jgi:C-terminal processing protease CtpA/Prc
MFASNLKQTAAVLLAAGVFLLGASPPRAAGKEDKEPPAKDVNQRIKELEEELTRLRQVRLQELTEELKKAEEKTVKAREELTRAVQGGDQATIIKAQEAMRKSTEERNKVQQERSQLESRIRMMASLTPTPTLRNEEQRLGWSSIPPNATLSDQLGLAEKQGRVLERVDRDSPAARAGLQAHDILLEIEGKPVPSAQLEFRNFLATLKPDTPLELVVLRHNKKQTIKGLLLPAR